MNKYMEYAVSKLPEIMAIDSPSGYTSDFIDYLKGEFETLGYSPVKTIKGSLIVDLGGNDETNGIVIGAHGDTLSGMVKEIKPNGRLKITNIGGLNANNVETENCRIVTKFNGVYTGCCQFVDASLHVNKAYSETLRNFDTVEVLLDENVKCKDDVVKLGISAGDYVCFDTRTIVTESGFIKSRFLDDKLSVAIVLAYAKYLKDENITPERKVFAYISVYEEVGYGASSLPCDVTESLNIDMGCVGDGIECDEHKVSICAKDSGGPYNYDVVTNLIKAAKAENADYSVDIYPQYGSDVEATLRAGHEIRHGLIGPGVYASHGYERSHKDGVLATLKILKGYIG
ncbi:MAG: M42 family metallopeptidase [Firmicutes bacterium]|nr:M42 family metallopeptidase [Bacillota bacterium]